MSRFSFNLFGCCLFDESEGSTVQGLRKVLILYSTGDKDDPQPY